MGDWGWMFGGGGGGVGVEGFLVGMRDVELIFFLSFWRCGVMLELILIRVKIYVARS